MSNQEWVGTPASTPSLGRDTGVQSWAKSRPPPNQEAEIRNLALAYFLFSDHAHAVYLPVHTHCFSYTDLHAVQRGVTTDEESLPPRRPTIRYLGLVGQENSLHCFSLLQPALWSGP